MKGVNCRDAAGKRGRDALALITVMLASGAPPYLARYAHRSLLNACGCCESLPLFGEQYCE